MLEQVEGTLFALYSLCVLVMSKLPVSQAQFIKSRKSMLSAAAAAPRICMASFLKQHISHQEGVCCSNCATVVALEGILKRCPGAGGGGAPHRGRV